MTIHRMPVKRVTHARQVEIVSSDQPANDEADKAFDTSLHRVVPERCKSCPLVLGLGGEGRGCACSDEETLAAYRAIWTGLCNAVRALTLADWLVLAAISAAAGATYFRP